MKYTLRCRNETKGGGSFAPGFCSDRIGASEIFCQRDAEGVLIGGVKIMVVIIEYLLRPQRIDGIAVGCSVVENETGET